MKVYIAGPLFCEGEKAENAEIEAVIAGCGHRTYLPQRDGGVIAELPELIDGKPKREVIFKKDLKNLEWCDVFVFVLDGRVPDEGASFAMGYAYAHGKRCVIYKSDVRSGYDGEDNLMLQQSAEVVLRNRNELRDYFA